MFSVPDWVDGRKTVRNTVVMITQRHVKKTITFTFGTIVIIWRDTVCSYTLATQVAGEAQRRRIILRKCGL